ncbi:MAG: hypothetical protein NWF11_01250 [Candidatus Bathyarchaeota archaeon]|nr:hypothetical protein [Candidatus Bathyarchaeota archaeon]
MESITQTREIRTTDEHVTQEITPISALSEYPKILCVVPSLPRDFNLSTLKTILQQTLPIDMIVILPKKVTGKTVGEKVSRVLNDGLSHLHLKDFDYILRVDSDTVIPHNFLEENLKGEPDLCGSAGYAMTIKVSTFERVMKGRFHPLSDDSYTSYKFMQKNCKVSRLRVKPKLLRRSGNSHGAMYFLNRGKAMFKHGYEPFHVLASFRWEWRNIVAVFGYILSLLKSERKFDTASFVWQKQVRRLFHS